MIDVEAWGNC